MGANAQTSVPAFTAGQVLTAAQVTGINTGIPVFASSTERDAAFGGTGEKTLAEGQMAYLEDTNETQYYDGSSWLPVGGGSSGLVLVSRTTVGTAVASVTVSGAFSSTYDNYKIVYSGGASSGAAVDIYMELGASTANYYSIRVGWRYANSALDFVDANSGSHWLVGAGTDSTPAVNLDVLGPNLAKNTFFSGVFLGASGTALTGGYHDDATQYTAFTIEPASGTFTGGYIDVYGYAKA